MLSRDRAGHGASHQVINQSEHIIDIGSLGLNIGQYCREKVNLSKYRKAGREVIEVLLDSGATVEVTVSQSLKCVLILSLPIRELVLMRPTST